MDSKKLLTFGIAAGGLGYLVYLFWRQYTATGRNPITQAGYTLRGLNNNNPGNIKYDPNITWQGQTSNDGVFVIFDTPQDGIRALMVNVLAKQNQGVSTLSALGDIWAPPASAGGDNDSTVGQYGASLGATTGIDPNQSISFSENLIPITKAIIKNEEGFVPLTYTDAVFTAAANDAINHAQQGGWNI